MPIKHFNNRKNSDKPTQEISTERYLSDNHVKMTISDYEDAKARRNLMIFKSKLAYSIGGVLIISLTAFCICALLQNNAPQDTRNFAKSMLTTVGSAVGGYVFAKQE